MCLYAYREATIVSQNLFETTMEREKITSPFLSVSILKAKPHSRDLPFFLPLVKSNTLVDLYITVGLAHSAASGHPPSLSPSQSPTHSPADRGGREREK